MRLALQYRPEVDGLRALAVIPVVLFHAGYPLFAGGFVGVDIFFVISGYLITSILIAELNQGSFSIVRFYERRARRILPVAGVCLILMFANERSSVGNILKLPPLVGVGLISYSLYLWHQPVLAFARIRLPELDQVATLTCILIATVLAYLSWRFIEAPFRDKNLFSRNKIFAISGLLAAFFVLVSGLIIFSKGAPARLPAEVVRLLSDFDDVNSRLLGRSCHLSGEVPTQPIQTCSDYLIPDQAPVLLIGDSHLDAVGVFIQRYLYDRGIGSYAVSYSGCIPIKGLYRPDTDNRHACASYNDEMLKFAAQNDVNTIILVSRWSLYILGSRYDNGEGGKEHGKPIYADELHIAREDSRYDDPLRIKRVRDRIKSQVESLSHDYNLAIIGPVPEVGWNVPQYLSKKAMFGKSDMPNRLTEPLTHSYDRFLARNQIINEVLVTLPDDVLIYSPETVLCVASSRRCKMNDQGGPLYYDDNHLSLHGADIIGKDFSSKLYMWGVREQYV